MDTRNLTIEDCHYIDLLCADEGARDSGHGLDRALARFGDEHDIALATDEIYTPTQVEFYEIAALAVHEINGG